LDRGHAVGLGEDDPLASEVLEALDAPGPEQEERIALPAAGPDEDTLSARIGCQGQRGQGIDGHVDPPLV
jgi:hypothetical protein